MKTNQEYKNAALAALQGKWAPAVICAVVYTLLTFACGTTGVLTLLVSLPLGVGFYAVHKNLLLNGDDRMTGEAFRIGFANWWHNTWGMLLMTIYIFLWTLLLVIPGIIKAFSYALVPYILVDRPELSANQAIDLSMKMMRGHKFDFFRLSFSFIGWGILSCLTLGIGFFWLYPYMYTSYAAFYEDVKAEYESRTDVNN